jgi:predicted TPR repeat methyltransferase
VSGPLLRPVARRLVGVDLSPKMLEQARRRGTYDALVCDELLAFMRRSEGDFDLVVAADVLIYFGDLVPVWEAARRALRPGGLLAVGTESAADGGYQLLPSGRFAHNLGYVRATSAAGFQEQACVETTLRQEAGAPVRGRYYILSRL